MEKLFIRNRGKVSGINCLNSNYYGIYIIDMRIFIPALRRFGGWDYMLRLHENRDLLNKINLLRRDLEKYLSMASKPTETEVVRMSQELDELLVMYYRQIGNIEDIGLSE